MPKCTNEDPTNLDLDADDDGPDFPYVDDDDDEEEDHDESVAVVAAADPAVAVVVDAAATAVGAATVPRVPPVPPSATPTSDNKKKPRTRGGRAPLMDDETMKAFALANNMSAKRFREVHCDDIWVGHPQSQ